MNTGDSTVPSLAQPWLSKRQRKQIQRGAPTYTIPAALNFYSPLIPDETNVSRPWLKNLEAEK